MSDEKIRNFGVQPDEETGYAEEQAASNMAAPRLETVEYRSRSVRGGFNFTRMAIPLRKRDIAKLPWKS